MAGELLALLTTATVPVKLRMSLDQDRAGKCALSGCQSQRRLNPVTGEDPRLKR